MGTVTRHRLVTVGLLAGLLGATVADGGHDAAPTRGGISHAAGRVTTSVAHDAVLGAALTGVPATGRGYTFLQRRLVAETPAGFRVWVDPRAPHHWAIASGAASAVKVLRALGTDIRWRGYGYPSSREGVVRIREGKKGCGDNDSTVGVTWTSWDTLPSGKRYATHADIALCPRLFRMGTWATIATVGTNSAMRSGSATPSTATTAPTRR